MIIATMNRAPEDQAGLALGAWGAVQATAAGLAMLISGGIRDTVNYAAQSWDWLPEGGATASGYITVYSLEIVLLIVAIVATVPILRRMKSDREIPGPVVTGADAKSAASGMQGP